MKVNEILNAWEEDSTINPLDISHEALKIPKLHHKYYSMYIAEKLLYESMQIEEKDLHRERWKFWNKMGDPEEYKSYDKDSYFDKKLMKSDKDIFIESDKELLEYKKKLAVQWEKVDLLKSIINSINNRSFVIKNFIESQKFQNGLI